VIFSNALFFGQHFKASIIKGLSLKTPQKMIILVNTSLSTPPRPPIATYRYIKPLDRQTYHRHHRKARETAHAKNGERIFCLSLPSIGAKLVFHKFVKNLTKPNFRFCKVTEPRK